MGGPDCEYFKENLEKPKMSVGYFFGKVFCNNAGCQNISESFYSSELDSDIRLCNTNGSLNNLESKAIPASRIPVPATSASLQSYASKIFNLFKLVKRTNPKTLPSCAE